MAKLASKTQIFSSEVQEAARSHREPDEGKSDAPLP